MHRRSWCRTARRFGKPAGKRAVRLPQGAFTGAERDRRVVRCRGWRNPCCSTKSATCPSLQAKLLRVLQEGEIRPLGGGDTHKVDVRIIAATHRDLALLVRDGKFREDLYYRLAQFPSSCRRCASARGDALELARHFAERACIPAPRAWAGRGSAGTARRLWRPATFGS
ncbi:sigma 54-interacting transcriptional regulator [Pseudomonas aeruginosa]